MKKDIVVVFGPNGARIYKGLNPEEWKNDSNVLINPDLTPLHGIPPHLWRLKANTIETTTESTKKIIIQQEVYVSFGFYAKVALVSFATLCLSIPALNYIIKFVYGN